MRMPTQTQIDAYRDKIRTQFKGFPVKVDSNGYGVRVECKLCNDSATRNPEMFIRNHFLNNH